jgi:hypothetical protein
MALRGRFGYKMWRLFKRVQVRLFPEFPEALCTVCHGYVGTPCETCNEYNHNFELAPHYQEEMDRIARECD